jgi:hypothetical protein
MVSKDVNSKLTAAEIDLLHRHALQAAHNSYSPYSHFRVGAAILLHTEPHAEPHGQQGAIVAGTNVENASYRLTSCAEQTAIAAAVSLYGPAARPSSSSPRRRHPSSIPPATEKPSPPPSAAYYPPASASTRNDPQVTAS